MGGRGEPVLAGEAEDHAVVHDRAVRDEQVGGPARRRPTVRSRWPPEPSVSVPPRLSGAVALPGAGTLRFRVEPAFTVTLLPTLTAEPGWTVTPAALAMIRFQPNVWPDVSVTAWAAVPSSTTVPAERGTPRRRG